MSDVLESTHSYLEQECSYISLGYIAGAMMIEEERRLALGILRGKLKHMILLEIWRGILKQLIV